MIRYGFPWDEFDYTAGRAKSIFIVSLQSLKHIIGIRGIWYKDIQYFQLQCSYQNLHFKIIFTQLICNMPKLIKAINIAITFISILITHLHVKISLIAVMLVHTRIFTTTCGESVRELFIFVTLNGNGKGNRCLLLVIVASIQKHVLSVALV